MEANDDPWTRTFLGTLFASVTDDTAFTEVLALLTARYGCLSAALVFIDSKRVAATIEFGYGKLDAAARQRYRLEYAKYDPAPAAMTKLRVGQVVSTGRLFDADSPQYERFIREFYYPLGLREAMGGPVANDQATGRFGVLAVQRGSDRPSFSDNEIESLASLMPHVAKALDLRLAFFQLSDQVETLKAALDTSKVATMIFTSSGALEHANLSSRAILNRGDGLGLSRVGRLWASDPGANRQIDQLLSNVAPLSKPLLIRAPRTNDEVPYVLKVAPSDAQKIIIKVFDNMLPDVEASTMLRAVFEMSASAARLTAALVNGQDLSSYATVSRISINTVKYHLQAAFKATATRRQSDLVAVAAAALRDLC